jgi:hypothetical protein
MAEVETPSMLGVLLGIAGTVLLYYAGTRGILLLTSSLAGRWHRRALVSLSFAALFAPSLMGVGHGGIFPVPAWVVAIEYASAGMWPGVLRWGLAPILVTWLVFFALSSVSSVLSKNNNKKVDTHGKQP